MTENRTASEATDEPIDDIAFVEMAWEAGYYDVPRKVTLVDLAERADISDQVACRKLRDGIRKILRKRQHELA